MTDLANARRLLESGDLAAAERVYEKILEAWPDNTEALNVAAMGALRQGQARRAVTLLERAAAAAPDDPATHHHLGRACQSVGDLVRARAAQARAVRLAPGFFLARLFLAACLEQLQEPQDALIQYKRALDDAHAQGRWLDPATTAMSLRPAVEHAVLAVRRGRRAAFETLLAPLFEKYGRDSMTRVERCLRIYLSEEPPVYPDPRQKPSFLLFPDLPTCAYFDPALFEWLDALQDVTGAIRGELEKLLTSPSGRERVFASEALEAENLDNVVGPPVWNGYYFFRHGIRRDENCGRCPATTRALDALPLSAIRDHGPEVLYSVFTPGTHLKPHRGVTNTRVVGHLPLIVPEDCALRVGGEIHEWREGRVVVFDDTYEHEAWNHSRSTRVVLIFDVWNPHLSEAERAAVDDVVRAIGDFRTAVEQVP
jgi:tetratricopeptide (TPR) repeat protein